MELVKPTQQIKTEVKVFDYSKTLKSATNRLQKVLSNDIVIRYITKDDKDRTTETKTLYSDITTLEKEIYKNNKTTEKINDIKNDTLKFLMKSSFRNNIRQNKMVLNH